MDTIDRNEGIDIQKKDDILSYISRDQVWSTIQF